MHLDILIDLLEGYTQNCGTAHCYLNLIAAALLLPVLEFFHSSFKALSSNQRSRLVLQYKALTSFSKISVQFHRDIITSPAPASFLSSYSCYAGEIELSFLKGNILFFLCGWFLLNKYDECLPASYFTENEIQQVAKYSINNSQLRFWLN